VKGKLDEITENKATEKRQSDTRMKELSVGLSDCCSEVKILKAEIKDINVVENQLRTAKER